MQYSRPRALQDMILLFLWCLLMMPFISCCFMRSLMTHSAAGMGKLRRQAWRQATDARLLVAAEALSCALPCTLCGSYPSPSHCHPGTLDPSPRCPLDGGLGSSLMSPWARMMAASRELATSLAIRLMAVLSALKTFRLETFLKKTFLLMKSESVLNFMMNLHNIESQGQKIS